MSAIFFEADLDSSKLESSIKSANRTVADWVKSVESGTQKMDTDVNKLAAVYRKAIDEQRKYVEELARDIDYIQKSIKEGVKGVSTEYMTGELVKGRKRIEGSKIRPYKT